MLGLSGRPDSKDGKRIEPKTNHGIEVMSIGFMIEEDTAMIWRGPMVTQALQQLLGETNWSDLDYLIIDLPPGTGDIQLTLCQRVPVSGAIIVTTPQDIALLDAKKALKLFEKVNVPVLGIVENMATHVCSNCGHEESIFGEGGGARMAEQYHVPLLGQLPLDIRIRVQADGGTPTVAAISGFRHRGALSRDCAQCGGAALAARGETNKFSFRRSSSRIRNALSPLPLAGEGRVRARGFDATEGRTTASLTPTLSRTREGGTSTNPFQVSSIAMTIKSDKWIRRMADQQNMIEPFEPGQGQAARRQTVSFRTAPRATATTCAAPMSSRCSRTSTRRPSIRRTSTSAASSTSSRTSASSRRIRSRSRARSNTSAFRARCSRSASASRRMRACGIIVNVTPLEPEWEGHVTLEFSNTTPLPAKIYANEGGRRRCCSSNPTRDCETSYKDRGGKYMGQRGVTLPHA